MISLSPKAQFLTNKDDRTAFANIASNPTIHKAMTHALAEIALEGATDVELKGAKRLMNHFLNMAETPEPAPTFPQKTLKTYA